MSDVVNATKKSTWHHRRPVQADFYKCHFNSRYGLNDYVIGGTPEKTCAKPAVRQKKKTDPIFREGKSALQKN